MIAVDTNILIYAHRVEMPFHLAATKQLIDDLRGNPSTWIIPWPCVHEFLGLVTNPRVFKIPTPLAAAFVSVETWLTGRNLQFIAESDGYLPKLSALTRTAQLAGPRIHDARITALCLHHGVRELWSADRDYSSFPQLKVRNPLVGA